MTRPTEFHGPSAISIRAVLNRLRQPAGSAAESAVWLFPSGDADGPAVLSAGWPEPCSTMLRQALTGRLIWWPSGLCPARTISILSSHLGRRPDRFPRWFDLLRTAVLRIHPPDECLLTVRDTAAYAAARRAAELFSVPRLDVTIDDGSADEQELARWLGARGSRSQPDRPDAPPVWRAEISPRLATAAAPKHDESIPLRDRIALYAATRCLLLSGRSGGVVARLIREWAISAPDRPMILFADRAGEIAGPLREQLAGQGAVPWVVRPCGSADTTEGLSTDADDSSDREAPRETATRAGRSHDILTCPENWLCHWTRARQGAWPDQPAIDFLDELLLGCDSTDRSALATLLRIVSQRRLLGSPVRDGRTAVSLTEVPLKEFRRRRVYRRHKRQYDFEPWGIGVRREELTARGARPVVYGTAEQGQAMPPAERIWFQLRAGRRRARRDKTIVWEDEREWRMPGNLSLDTLPQTAVCVFVDRPSEVPVVSACCPWPVIVTPE